MQAILPYLQIGLAILMIATILLQQRGTGLSGTFGGGGGIEYSTKRGAEKVLFYTTIVIATLFIIISVLSIYLA